MMKRYHVSVGINDYAGSGNDLQGCVNDAFGWSRLFTDLGSTGQALFDHLATKKGITDALEEVISKARFGDRIYWSFSGHGTRVVDSDGDESDGFDEALVPYDWDRSLLLDDEIYQIIESRRFGVRFYTFSDSCHSGTVARLLDAPKSEQDFLRAVLLSQTKARYFPPEQLGLPSARGLRPREKASRPGAALFAGCQDEQVSWDAHIDGKPQGAFSWAALSTFNPAFNLKQWHAATVTRLSTSPFDQTPRLEARTYQKYWGM